jgi:hypothetical protein
MADHKTWSPFELYKSCMSLCEFVIARFACSSSFVLNQSHQQGPQKKGTWKAVFSKLCRRPVTMKNLSSEALSFEDVFACWNL